MSDVVDLKLGKKIRIEDPRCFRYHFIDPSAVSCGFTSKKN